MNNTEIAIQTIAELQRLLSKVEGLGALIAAAHVDSAIELICKEFRLGRLSSVSD